MKRTMFLFPVVAVGLAIAALPVSMKSAKAESEYDNLPTAGEVPADSYFGNAWGHDVGTRRINDRSLIAVATADWGMRGNFLNRTFDATSFEITLDLSKILSKSAVALIFSSAPGGYCSEDSRQLSMDIVKGDADPHAFIVTASNGTLLHNISIPGFTDGQQWADDSNFNGVQTQTLDDKLTIKLSKINNATSEITINDIKTTVATDNLYKYFEDPTVSNVSLGIFNNNGTQQSYIIENVGDASDKVYFGADGNFTTVKNGLATLKNAPLGTISEVQTAKETFDVITAKYNALYRHDQAYFATDYQSIKTNVDAAVEAMGNKLAVVLLGQTMDALDAAVGTLTTVELTDAALALKADYDARKDTIKIDELESEDEATFNALEVRYAAACAKIDTAVRTLYNATVTAYEAKVTTIVSNKEVVEAQTLRSAIPTKYDALVGETEAQSLQGRIAAADVTYTAKTTLTHNNWVQGTTSTVVTKQDGSLDVTSYGAAMGVSRESSSGIYCTEALFASDFETTINIDRLPSNNGAWITLGLMEKPEMWIFAENDSVQENKGIFYLITYINSETLGVQAFLCSMTSNRFYDSPLTQTIKIPTKTDIKIKFFEETTTIAGVTETYFRMKFNDVGFDQENISAKKIRTVLGKEKMGYFFTATSGYHADTTAVYTIKDINGKSPITESLAKETTTTPTSTDTEKNYTKGSGDVTFNLVATSVKSVKVGNTVLASDKYGYANNTLTIKGEALASLNAGNHTVVAECEGGNVTWILKVADAASTGGDKADEGAKKKGCGGSIVASSAVIAVAALAGLGATLLKKKED